MNIFKNKKESKEEIRKKKEEEFNKKIVELDSILNSYEPKEDLTNSSNEEDSICEEK